MKKTIFFAGAMMLLASVACNKETQTDNQPSVELKPQVTLSFNAALTTPTKTEIGNSETADGVTVHEIYWSKDDKIAVYPHDPDSNTGVNGVEFTSEDLAETSAAEAVFTGEIDAADAYYAFYPTTAGAKWNGGTYSDFSVTLPYEQTANGIASGFAVANVTGTEKVTFDHVCGFVKFTINETYAGKIKEVRFSGKNSEALAGKLVVYPDDMNENKINSSQQTVLTLSPSAGETFAAGTYYFTCFPVELTKGLELTFIDSDDKEAVKSSDVAANIERAGVLNLGTVANLEFESVTPPLADGTYVILAKKGEVYYAMGSDKYGTSNRLNESVFDYTATETHEETLVWTITTQNNKITISSSNSTYLSAGTLSGRYTLSQVTVENPAPVLTLKNGNSADTYIIESVVSDVTYTLARNDSACGFAFYTSTQNNNLYLKPITYVYMPELQAPVISLIGNNEDKTVTVTWTDVENATSYEVVCGENTQTVNKGVQTCTLTMDAYGTYKVTVTANADGYVSATSEVVSCTLASKDSDYYVKVTETPADWSGKYLLVCDTKGIAFSAFSDKYGSGADVEIAGGQILSDEKTDSYQIVISAATATTGAYTIKFGDKFFNWSSGNTLNGVDTESVNENWKLSVDSGNTVIVNATDETRKLQWNASNPRFACYTSSQTAVQLYKLEE